MTKFICWCLLVAFISNNMDPDQTTPYWAVWSGFIVFDSMIKVIWSAFEKCSRHNKQTTFFRTKNIGRIRVNTFINFLTLYALMDSSFFVLFNKVGMVHCIYWGVMGYNFHIKNLFLSLKIVFVIANSVDPDEMPHYTAFHLGLHCLPKNAFRSH